MRRLALLVVLGCGEQAPTAEVPQPPVGTVASAPAAPATVTPVGKVDGAGRRARFDQRATVPIPSEWPAPWKALLTEVEAKLLAASNEVRARVDDAPPYAEITMSFRMFGEDAACDARLLAALKARGLPGDALPDGSLDAGPVQWKLTIARLKGEAPRETQVDLAWRRQPADPADPPACKKPKALELPSEAPPWLDSVSNTRSTRRRVVTQQAVGPDGLEVGVAMLYQNGYAQDEGVGHFTALARKQGFALGEGEGLRQTWRHPQGGVLSWSPTRRDLWLGCALEGPVLELSWRSQ